MRGPTLVPYQSRKCFYGVRPTGEDGPYRCHKEATVECYSRAWCDTHNPMVNALETAFAMLIQVTRKDAA